MTDDEIMKLITDAEAAVKNERVEAAKEQLVAVTKTLHKAKKVVQNLEIERLQIVQEIKAELAL